MSRSLISLAVVPVVLAACAGGRGEGAGAGSEDVQAGPLKVTEQTLTGFSVEAMIDLTNSSKEPLQISGATFELLVDDRPMNSGTLSFNQILESGGLTSLKIPAQAEIAKDEATLAPWTARGEQAIPLLLRGELQVNLEGRPRESWPFARTGELRAPRLPVAKINDAEAARYENNEIGLAFYLGLDNQNPFPIHIKSATYKIVINGKQVAEGIASVGDRIPASKMAEYEVLARLSPAQFGPELHQLVQDNKLAYVKDGNVDLGIAQVPFKLSGDLKFSKGSKGHKHHGTQGDDDSQ
jgi:LEA14-like dessication related protein